MSRAWRIEYEGAYYHLMSRGNDGQDIYLSDEDRRLFLETLAEMASRFEVDIFAYVLMSNHYHLLVQTRLANLKKAMQWMGSTYTRRFNNCHGKTGHLFQGRYKSILVQNDAYVMQLSCYIHRNPLRAGIVNRLIDYPWSSYGVYAYDQKRPEWLSTELILSYFKNPIPQKQYREKVQRYAAEEKRLLEDLRHSLILGAQNFVEEIRRRFLPDTPHKEFPQQRQLAGDFHPEAFLVGISKALQVDLDRYISSKRLRGADKQNRDLMVYLLWNTGRLTNEEIGKLFGKSFSAVSHSVKSFKQKLDEDKKLKRQFEQLNSQFKL
ncbi:MAG: transposase [Desulfobacteraceae bacterium]|jgi:putative transposase|nr:transposase [Desulfobacteraceae bacterium]